MILELGQVCLSGLLLTTKLQFMYLFIYLFSPAGGNVSHFITRIFMHMISQILQYIKEVTNNL